jgi:predicted ribosomally synthesized peptide with nif11-like leader
MSTEAVRAFGEKMQKDEQFRKQVQTVMAAAQQRSTAELLKVASGAGFQFTEAELATAVQSQLKQRYASGELKDEDLLQVSGGWSPVLSTLVVAPAISAFAASASVASLVAVTIKSC